MYLDASRPLVQLMARAARWTWLWCFAVWRNWLIEQCSSASPSNCGFSGLTMVALSGSYAAYQGDRIQRDVSTCQ
jgi:hypothetical protein